MDHVIGKNVDINKRAEIHVTGRLVIGDDSKIAAGCVIEGRDIEIGRGFWMLPGAVIGGGSAYEAQSSLRAGHFLHMGRNSLINTTRHVEIGDEVGLGTGTSIFTHGAYLSALEGFPVSFAPVTIGDRVWLPGATVNPGVTIGSDVVVGVGSVVTRDIPSGSLALGIPAKVTKEGAYPAPVDLEAFWSSFFRSMMDLGLDDALLSRLSVDETRRVLRVGTTYFDTAGKRIEGEATPFTERIKDQLRRNGVRFYSSAVDGVYLNWR